MASKDEVKNAQKVVEFLRINNPKEIKNRLDIVNNLPKGPAVFLPSIIALLCDSVKNKEVKISMFFKGKEYKTKAVGLESERLIVKYYNRIIGEIIESGSADKFYITFDGDNVCRFKVNDNSYIPYAEKEGDFIYPTILYPFYKKDCLDIKTWEKVEQM